MIRLFRRLPVRPLSLWLLLMLISAAAIARGPRLLVVVDAGVGWAHLTPDAIPAAAAVAGMSDPATEHGWAGALLTLGSGGRNVEIPALRHPATIPLYPTPAGHWQIAPALWQALSEANARAHAGAQLGNLGAALHGRRRVVLIASAEQVGQVALVAADHSGAVDAWFPSLDTAPLDDAVVFLAPASGQGVSLVTELARRYPQTPALYYSALPIQTRDGVIHDLTPVLLFGHGGGLLSSRRTHWRGVVSALDFAPTVLQLAGVPLSEPMTDPLSVAPYAQPVPHVQRIAAQARATYPAMICLDAIYFTAMGLLLALPALNIGTRIPLLRGIQLSSWLVAVLLALVLPWCWFLPLSWLVVLMVAGWVLLAMPLARLPIFTGWVCAAAIAVCGLLLNTVFSLTLAPQPLLGYHLVMGYRYYGIGNEPMGVLVTILTMLVGWLLYRYRTHHALIIFTCFGVTALALGATWWGANWGGAMTAILSGLLFALVHFRQRLRWWHIPAMVGLAVLLGVAMIVVLTLLYPLAPSHPGELGREIMHNGLPALGVMIARKLAMSYRMWSISQGWISVGGAVFVGLMLIWFYRRYQPARLHPQLTPLWEAIVVAWWGAVLAGIVNDNGVGLTGFMWIPMTPAIGMLLLHWRATRDQPGPTP